MPKLGMPPVRRRALIDAAICAIAERGSLDVTMSDIAARAGVSSALAHHYFGAKEALLHASMRHILGLLADELRAGLQGAAPGRERISAIIGASFSDTQFRPEIIAAWLAFYVEAQKNAALRRLFRIYARRLHSDLMSGLLVLLPRREAERAAEGIAALIDGLYIRCALREDAPDAAGAIALVEDYLDVKLANQRTCQ